MGNQILVTLDCQKMLLLTILEVQNFDFSKFEQLSSPKFTQIIKFRQSQALTSHFESFWSIVYMNHNKFLLTKHLYHESKFSYYHTVLQKRFDENFVKRHQQILNSKIW